MFSKISDCRPTPAWAHVYGAFATLWGVAAWSEWFVTPLLVPDRGGPVPYLIFAPLVFAFALGALWLTGSLLLAIPGLSCAGRLFYVSAPFSYLLFHLVRLLAS